MEGGRSAGDANERDFQEGAGPEASGYADQHGQHHVDLFSCLKAQWIFQLRLSARPNHDRLRFLPFRSISEL
jgi:hypothetical protein